MRQQGPSTSTRSSGIDPLYLDRPNRVFNYSDPQLLISGQNGSAIGTNCDFSDITQDPTPCEILASAPATCTGPHRDITRKQTRDKKASPRNPKEPGATSYLKQLKVAMDTLNNW